jgi:translation initiation factor 2 subunit 2
MESYEQMLKDAYSRVKVVRAGGERFEVPKAKGMISGKNTIITNINEIASCLRRPVEHIMKFLLQQLAVSGKIDGERLILNTKLTSEKVNDKIALYTKEFVLCNECGKPDTEIAAEKGIKFKKCLACGAKSPAKSFA